MWLHLEAIAGTRVEPRGQDLSLNPSGLLACTCHCLQQQAGDSNHHKARPTPPPFNKPLPLLRLQTLKHAPSCGAHAAADWSGGQQTSRAYLAKQQRLVIPEGHCVDSRSTPGSLQLHHTCMKRSGQHRLWVVSCRCTAAMACRCSRQQASHLVSKGWRHTALYPADANVVCAPSTTSHVHAACPSCQLLLGVIPPAGQPQRPGVGSAYCSWGSDLSRCRSIGAISHAMLHTLCAGKVHAVATAGART